MMLPLVSRISQKRNLGDPKEENPEVVQTVGQRAKVTPDARRSTGTNFQHTKLGHLQDVEIWSAMIKHFVSRLGLVTTW